MKKRLFRTLLLPALFCGIRFSVFLLSLLTLSSLTLPLLTPGIVSAAPKPAAPNSPVGEEKNSETSKLSPTSLRSAQMNEKGAGFAEQGKFEEAEQALREAVQIDPTNVSAMFNLGSVLIQRGKLQEAASFLEQKANEVKTDAGLFARLGDAYFSLKNVGKARANYEQALRLDPDLPRIPARLGTVYTLTQGLPNNLEKAIEQYLKAVDQEPSNTEYLANLVNLYLATNESGKAVSTAKRALQVSPSPALYAALGAAYELEQEWKNSLIAYQRAKDLGDKSDELNQKIKALKTKLKQ